MYKMSSSISMFLLIMPMQHMYNGLCRATAITSDGFSYIRSKIIKEGLKDGYQVTGLISRAGHKKRL
jgi:hypothetical protein